VYVPIGDGSPRQDCLIHDPTEDTECRDRMTLVRMPSLRTDRRICSPAAARPGRTDRLLLLGRSGGDWIIAARS
jgi:hypothetical protein